MARLIEFDIMTARESAMKLFWRNGYQASSLSDLLDEMKIGRGSFYAAFGDKRRLYLECLDLFVERTFAIVQKTRDKHPPMDAIRYFLQHSLNHREGSKAGFGCMAVNTVIELAGVDDELAAAASVWLSKLQALFEDCLCEAGYSPARAAEYAAYLMLVNEGVRVASRRKLPRRQSLEAIDTALRLLQAAPR
jgi:TetR/AcrR family transcriptional regulator, transcriptional repressor for nem operon